MRTPALLLYLVMPFLAPEPSPIPHNAAAFTPADVARAEGLVVHFYGVVEDLDAFEELHVAYLTTDGLSGHRWHALPATRRSGCSLPRRRFFTASPRSRAEGRVRRCGSTSSLSAASDLSNAA